MATLYQKRNTWYLSVSYNQKRITRSLGTKDKSTAKQLKPQLEYEILSDLLGNKQKTIELSFPDLVNKYLKADHGWAKATYELNQMVFNQYLNNKPLPTNPTSRAIYIRTINACWNWGKKYKLITQAHKLEGDTKGEARQRVLTKNELKILFKGIRDKDFRDFVKFAYFTGGRSSEIRSLRRENIKDGYIVVLGKTGSRILKLNSQALDIINYRTNLWNYTKSFVSHKFKSETRRLGLKDVRFHDIIRTFGYNLITQGKPIYEVCKLLGHTNISTTEKHYAPLLVSNISDFIFDSF